MNILHSAKNPDWGTPDDILARVRSSLGAIDLDPASDEEHNLRVQAKQIYTVVDDGLTKPWNGRVFLNPPGGRGLAKKFFAKFEQEYTIGNMPAGIYLGYSLNHLAWMGPWKDTIHGSGCIMVLNKRIKFVGAGNNPTHYNFVLLLAREGRIHHQFISAFQGIGWRPFFEE